MLDEYDKKGHTLPPSFFFIDPFGYSGFPMATLKRILTYERSELFINFMIYDINRFLEAGHSQNSLKGLFGCDDYCKIESQLESNEKYERLINLYCSQLKEYAGAKYVMPFRINTPGQGLRAKYFLVHASNNIKALREMKNSMAKLSDSQYKFEAIGIDPQLGIFEAPEKTSLRSKILEYCKKHDADGIEYIELGDWAYANTNGIDKTIKEALLMLEKEGSVTIQRMTRQKKHTIVKGAIIKPKN